MHTLPRWSLITKHIPRCTDDTCSKQYCEALNPQLKQDEWMDAEDVTLLKLTAQLGSKWTQVGHAMGRRSGMSWDAAGSAATTGACHMPHHVPG